MIRDATARPPQPAAPADASPPKGVLATAIYVTGSSHLESGRRYAIAVDEDRLLILGPADSHPARVALERPLATITAQAVEGRFLASDARDVVLAFMSVGGPSPKQLADMVTEAATQAVAR